MKEDNEQRIARYLVGFHPQIQDELAFSTFYKVDNAYNHALKSENKLKR